MGELSYSLASIYIISARIQINQFSPRLTLGNVWPSSLFFLDQSYHSQACYRIRFFSMYEDCSLITSITLLKPVELKEFVVCGG